VESRKVERERERERKIETAR